MQLRYNVATSLDGFIAPLDESTSWIVEDSTIDFDALYASFDAFVMGRKSYEIITADPRFNPLEGRAKQSIVVISRSLKEGDHPGITILRDGYIEHIRKMKQQTGKGIWLMGGGWLATECLEAGLLDAVHVAVMPVLLGSGFKLISGESKSGGGSYKLALCSVDKLDSGILMTRYNVVRAYGGASNATSPCLKKKHSQGCESV